MNYIETKETYLDKDHSIIMEENKINMALPKVSLDQWIIFQTIIQTGSFANAANTLHKSQSSISYNMTKMQELMGIELFKISGRKAVLTKAGELILKRSQKIVSQLSQLENSIAHYKDGTEHQFTILIDELFPIELLANTLNEFEALYPSTHVMLINCRSEICQSSLQKSKADCAITRNKVRADSEKIITLECYPYAHPDYGLHADEQKLCLPSLHHHRQIIHEAFSVPKVENSCHHCCQWQVDSLNLMMELIASKQGYGWLPCLHAEKSHLPLKRLNIESDISIQHPLYLSNADPMLISNTQQTFIKIIKNLFQ